MTGFHLLWLPILLSSVIVFLVSWVLHTLLPWHKNDFAKLPDENRVREALRSLAIPPGDYHVPCPSSMAEMRAPEFKEKMIQGPVLFFTVLPNGLPQMGKNLLQWFLYLVVAGILAAYVSGRALPPGAPYLSVFRFAGVTAFIAHSVALWQMSIWYQRSWGTTFRSTVDGLIYALLTAGVFGWLWPR